MTSTICKICGEELKYNIDRVKHLGEKHGVPAWQRNRPYVCRTFFTSPDGW